MTEPSFKPFYKDVSKNVLSIMADTITAYPIYKGLVEDYRKKAGEISKMIDTFKQPYEPYFDAIEKIGSIFFSELESLVQERLKKFDVDKDTITDFFNGVISLDNNQLVWEYAKNTEITNEINEAMRARELQMAYLSGIIHKLNPETVELTIPESIDYPGRIGNNLNYNGKLTINGNLQKLGGGIIKANLEVNGNIEELNLEKKEINATINGNVYNLNLNEVGELKIVGDVTNAKIGNSYDKIEIHGEILKELIYRPFVKEEELSEESLKQFYGSHKQFYDQSKRETFVVNGNVILYYDPKCSPEELVKIVNTIDFKGKITAIADWSC